MKEADISPSKQRKKARTNEVEAAANDAVKEIADMANGIEASSIRAGLPAAAQTE